mmetsp:Transcript_18985/g.26793  ORF Transcript_18985/g.26793 Transcript_18985/m.26793 type:complete len:753 (-) Transcript_18985:166-2424(-)
MWISKEADDDLSVATNHGIYRRKYHVRALFQSIFFVVLVGGYSTYNFYVNPGNNNMEMGAVGSKSSLNVGLLKNHRQLREVSNVGLDENDEITWGEEGSFGMNLKEQDEHKASSFMTEHNRSNNKKRTQKKKRNRRLKEDGKDCDSSDKADPKWMLVFYIIGVLYMFLALAIVCDEFFVPALEEMSCERHLNLSMDVAGATLMAAGGSAPELFTSLIGTFQESEVGIGTIVGSAVFNVLFVIAMCSLLAKETLTLTWWPLFRDSAYYAAGLIVLALFVGVISEGEIQLWEAIILLGMYLGYILLMAYNRDIYKSITGKELVMPDDDDDDDDAQTESDHANGELEQSRSSGKGSGTKQKAHFRWQGTFRAGILKLIRDPESWLETAGNGIVAKIAGNVDQVFEKVDADGNGEIDKEELAMLFQKLDCALSPSELDHVFETLDTDKNGKICRTEFSSWYCASEERILNEAKHVFDSYDKDNSSSIDKDELKDMLLKLDPKVTDDDIAEVMEVMYKHGDPNEISYEEFADWYKSSLMFEQKKHEAEEDAAGVWESLKPPVDKSCTAWVWYILLLPLVVLMTFTIPDVRRPGMGKWCYAGFFLSILHIGGYSYLMVSWAEVVGNTIGIPSVILGLTILAAGTSVPDLLSSVIVARRGSGDMAVSSSIGSNIFDILVGLPLPWICYTAYPNTPSVVKIGSDNIALSISILIGMLVFVIAAVHCQGWRLTKTLGALMFLFYFGFLAQAIVMELPFDTC